MKVDKLFGILVLGGAMLVANSAAAEQVNTPIPTENEEKQPVFCNVDPPATCEKNEEGKMVPKKGLECCWGTSCEAN